MFKTSFSIKCQYYLIWGKKNSEYWGNLIEIIFRNQSVKWFWNFDVQSMELLMLIIIAKYCNVDLFLTLTIWMNFNFACCI